VKISFKTKNEINIFLDKQKLREVISGIPTFQEILRKYTRLKKKILR